MKEDGRVMEIRPDRDGSFGEVVARFADGMVRAETMSDKGCYVGFYWDDGSYCQWWISSKKKLEYRHEHGVNAAPKRDIPRAICGYPLPNWRLNYLEHSKEYKGWIVSIEHERSGEQFLSKSKVGPLEAWDECLRNIVAAEERRASDSDGSPDGGDAAEPSPGEQP